MILSGPAIHAAHLAGDIRISPFNTAQVNPASYDLTLGDELCVYARPGVDRSREHGIYSRSELLPEPPFVLDACKENASYRARLDRKGFVIGQQRVVLLHTAETVFARKHAWVVDGKSSLGRLGLAIHVTAGYGDPGFDGQVTLEVVALGEPVRIYPGMRIAQVRFMPVVDEYGAFDHVPHYQAGGHYVGRAARGPVPSRSYLQFEDRQTTIPAPPEEETGSG